MQTAPLRTQHEEQNSELTNICSQSNSAKPVRCRSLALEIDTYIITRFADRLNMKTYHDSLKKTLYRQKQILTTSYPNNFTQQKKKTPSLSHKSTIERLQVVVVLFLFWWGFFFFFGRTIKSLQEMTLLR